MRILRGKVLKCANGICDCRFQLERSDLKKLRDVPSIDCGFGYAVISCPKCGEDVVVS